MADVQLQVCIRIGGEYRWMDVNRATTEEAAEWISRAPEHRRIKPQTREIAIATLMLAFDHETGSREAYGHAYDTLLPVFIDAATDAIRQGTYPTGSTTREVLTSAINAVKGMKTT